MIKINKLSCQLFNYSVFGNSASLHVHIILKNNHFCLHMKAEFSVKKIDVELHIIVYGKLTQTHMHGKRN